MEFNSAKQSSPSDPHLADTAWGAPGDRRGQYAIVAGFSALFIAYFVISWLVPFLSHKLRLYANNRRTLDKIKSRMLDFSAPGDEQNRNISPRQGKYEIKGRERHLYKLKNRRTVNTQQCKIEIESTDNEEINVARFLPKFQLRTRDVRPEHSIVEERSQQNDANAGLDSATLYRSHHGRPHPSEVSNVVSAIPHDYSLLLQQNPWRGPIFWNEIQSTSTSSSSSSSTVNRGPYLTSNISANRALRESQDREYAASLTVDLQRQQAEDENIQQQDQLRKLAEDRQRCFRELPEEPLEGTDSVYTYAFKFLVLGSDGQGIDADSRSRENTVKRRFRASDIFDDMLNFVENHPLCPIFYTSVEIITSYPKLSFSRSREDATLTELGLNTHTRLTVQISID